jgi:AraC family transcriptional regulator, regulatory protein of adaptative response / methylated-DNA-[protein]-cysteine methyltransferase
MKLFDPDEAWAAVLRRDRSMDGQFITGVLTTGIYCRPSCAARHPLRKNVQFFDNGAEARHAGLRPCKRCLPDDIARDDIAITRAIELLKSGQVLSLDNLAREVGYASHHFQRLFKRRIGMSPAAYTRELRAVRAEKELAGNGRITDAIYAAGYSAPSRFYEDIKRRWGMTPTAWKNGGAGVTIHYAIAETTLGNMLVAATEKGICRLSFDEDESELRRRFPNAEIILGGPQIQSRLAYVIAAAENPSDMPDIPLDVSGTDFQRAIWAELIRIPAGETRSYAQLAAAVGKPKAVRAAGSANGANNVAVLIPCHRVIRSDGSLGGYAYGLKIKQELLRRESGD